MATIKRRFVLCLAWAGIGALAATAVSLPAADDAAMGLSPVPPAKPLPSFLPPEPPLDTTGTEPLSWKHLECLREYAWWKLFDLHPRLLRHNYRLAQAQTSVLKREWRQSLVYDLEIDADRGIRKAFGHPCTWYGEWQDPRDCDKWKTNATRDTEERQEWRLPVPDCMFKLLGSDFFWHVVGIRSTCARDIALAQDLPYLRRVDLSGPSWRDVPRETDLQALTLLPRLTHVNLRSNGAGIGDQGLPHLSGLKWLTHLDLAGTKVTDEGLSHLTSLRRLTHLDLHGWGSMRVTKKGLPSIARLSELTHLAIFAHGEVGDVGLQCLSGLKHLQQLRISAGGNYTLAGIQHLRTLPNLTHLAIHGIYEGNALQALRGHPRLSDLDVWWFSEQDMGVLPTLPHLRHLRIGCREISSRMITDLGAARQLESLQLCYGGEGLPPHALRGLATLDRLAYLTIDRWPLRDADLADLGALPRLTYLTLESTEVTDDGLEYIGRLKKLKGLDLRGQEITGAGLDHLGGLKELTHLYVDVCDENYESYMRLRNELPKLKYPLLPP